MTPLSKSREDAQKLNKPLVPPRTQIRIGNWDVRTMYMYSREISTSCESDESGEDPHYGNK